MTHVNHACSYLGVIYFPTTPSFLSGRRRVPDKPGRLHWVGGERWQRPEGSQMMNHINSYKRKKLNNRNPYETFSFYYGEDVLKKLGCSPVAAENIILKPKLLKK